MNYHSKQRPFLVLLDVFIDNLDKNKYFTLRKFVDDIELAGIVDTAENKNSKKNPCAIQKVKTNQVKINKKYKVINMGMI